MKNNLRKFFQVIIAVFGVCIFAFMLREPQLEGVNVNKTLFEIYFKDPFIAYAYFSSIPFFVGLYQIYKMLGTEANVKSLKIVKYCALAMILLAIGGEVIIFSNTSDDRAGGVMMGVLIILAATIAAFVAARFERLLLRRECSY